MTAYDRSLVMDNPYTGSILLEGLSPRESFDLLSQLAGPIPTDLAQFVAEKLDFQPSLLVCAAKRVRELSVKEKKSVVKTWTEMLENIKSRNKEDEWPYYIASLTGTTRFHLESVLETVIKRSNIIEECFHLLVLAKGCNLPLKLVERFISKQFDVSEEYVEMTLRDAPFLRICDNKGIKVNGVVYRLLCDLFASTIRSERMINRLRTLCQFCIINTQDNSATKVFRQISTKIMQYLALIDIGFRDYEERRSLHHELGKVFLWVLVDYTSAVRCFTKAISIFEESKETTHPEYAQLLNSLGNVLRLTGNMDDAFKYLSKSLKINKSITQGNVSEGIASCLSSLGLLCLSQGKIYLVHQEHDIKCDLAKIVIL